MVRDDRGGSAAASGEVQALLTSLFGPLLDDEDFMESALAAAATEYVGDLDLDAQERRYVVGVARNGVQAGLDRLTDATFERATLSDADRALAAFAASSGITFDDLEDGYRRGHRQFLRQATQAVASSGGDAELLARALVEVSDRVHAHLDEQCDALRSEFRTRGHLSRWHLQTRWAKHVLEAQTSRSLAGYALDAEHVAIVAWCDAEPPQREPLMQATHAALRELLDGAPQSVTTAPAEDTLRCWLTPPLARRHVEEVAAALPEGVRLAVGDPGADAAGFRATAREADAARNLALLVGAERRDEVRWFGDDRTLATLAMRPALLAPLAEATLGGLAGTSPDAARCREAVLAYHLASRSLSTAAARLFIHKNTLQTRLRRAERLAGYDVRHPSVDLIVALSLMVTVGTSRIDDTHDMSS